MSTRQSTATKAGSSKRHDNMSEIDSTIATHENKPSSQLEAENGDNGEEDDYYDVTWLIIKQHSMLNLWY